MTVYRSYYRNSLEIERNMKIPLDLVSGDLCLRRRAVRNGDVIGMEHPGLMLSHCFTLLLLGSLVGWGRRNTGEKEDFISVTEGHCAPELFGVI